MHKIAISPTALERMTERMGKLHPFGTIEPRKAALLVIDMQNYFVKPDALGEIPLARDIVPNINRLAAGLRRRGGHVAWIRNGTRDTRESWSTFHECLMTPDRQERRYAAMDIDGDGYAYWHLNDIKPEDAQLTKTRYSAFIQGSSGVENYLRDGGIDTLLIAGTATNVCCESSARDAMMLNFKVIMVSTRSPPIPTKSTTQRSRRSTGNSATCRRPTRRCKRWSGATRRARPLRLKTRKSIREEPSSARA
jgi:ureidoacrylate peracid hydrolase